MALLVEVESADSETEMEDHRAFLRSLEEHLKAAINEQVG